VKGATNSGAGAASLYSHLECLDWLAEGELISNHAFRLPWAATPNSNSL